MDAPRLSCCSFVVAAFLTLFPARLVATQEAVDLQRLVARADLDYDRPAERSEEGVPIGNGRTGTLVWTTPDAMHVQVNRVDVFAEDCTTTSFPRPHSDYASGCTFADVRFDDFSDGVFAPTPEFRQRLSVYDGVMTLSGRGVTARAIALRDHDVIAIEIDDRRGNAPPVSVYLRMLRYATTYVRGRPFPSTTQPHSNVIQTGEHTATSALEVRDNGRIVLTQEFREKQFYNASAVAARVVGHAARASVENETTVRATAGPGPGKFVLLIASASSFDEKQDVAAKAIEQLDAVAGKSFDELLESNRAWWRDFWSRGYISLHSDDGVADFLEANYTYFLYVMASCSWGGDYPARFGGMLWYSNGDLRAWGSQYWWANQSCYYNGLAPTNRFELMDPTFAMYSRAYDSWARAAKQQWGSEGIWIPETTWFNGLAELPDDIATEMRQLYLLQKPWGEHSNRFMRYADVMQSFNSRWNWISQDGRFELGRWVMQDKGAPPFGHVTHIMGTTAKVAWLYWQRYEYTLDRDWLRDRAYPMLRGGVEFYRNFPNVKKEADGKYHVHHTNSNEPAWGVRDSDEDLSALRGILPAAIRAAEILDVDAELRASWREFLANLAPIPTSDDPDALKPADYDGPRVWVKGRKPAAKAAGLLPDGNTLPQWNFDLCTVNTTDAERIKLANATFDAFFRNRPLGRATTRPAGTLSRLPIAGAALGRADAVQYLLPGQVRTSDRATTRESSAPTTSASATTRESGVFRNRMALREGPGATECERLGRAAEALHTALLQTAPPEPGGEPVVRVFPAWPREWDATFKLLARGAFVITSRMSNGRVEFVEIESRAGVTLRLVNPWVRSVVIADLGNGQTRELSGELILLPTTRGQRITLRAR